jgi:hypothetical protein
LNCRWLPLWRARRQPSISSIFTTSRIFISSFRLGGTGPYSQPNDSRDLRAALARAVRQHGP